MTGFFLAAGIVLTIAALIVRDQTELKLSRLRAELLALRSEEQRLGEDRTELERMIAQIGDALMRAERRRKAMEQSAQELIGLLEDLGAEVDETPQSGTDILPGTE